MNNTEIEDELRSEYDLKSLQVRKMGAGRKSFGDMVRLEPDIVAAFPDAKSVNVALRSLIEIAKRSTNLTLKADSSVNNPPLL